VTGQVNAGVKVNANATRRLLPLTGAGGVPKMRLPLSGTQLWPQAVLQFPGQKIVM